MQQLRTLCPQLQGIVHQHQGTRNRLQSLRGMYGLYQQVQERCHHLHTPQAGLRCCLPGNLRGTGAGKRRPPRISLYNCRVCCYGSPQGAGEESYNPQIQISAESGTKRSIFRQKNKTKRSKNRLHTTLIKPEQKVNEDLCSGFVLS